MGAWGTGLFEDDTACDVRDNWKELYAAFDTPEEVLQCVLEDWGSTLDDADTGPVIWLTIALMQWRYGCLTQAVKDRALSIIDNGKGLDVWREADPKDLRARQRVYSKLRDQLCSPPRPLKKIRKKKILEQTSLQPGHLLRFTLASGHSVIFLVGAVRRYKGERLPVCVVYWWPHHTEPALTDIAKLKPWLCAQDRFTRNWILEQTAAKPDDEGTKEFVRMLGGAPDFSTVMLRGSNRRDYPGDRIQVLADNWVQVIEGKPAGPPVIEWSAIDTLSQTWFKETPGSTP